MQNPFHRRLLIASIAFVVIASSMLALSATVKYKPYGVPDLLRAKYERKVSDIKARNRAIANHDKLDLPQTVVSNTEFDFGWIDPASKGSHVFLVRNEGSSPLILTGGETSCKCTLVSGGKQIIEPGDSGEVEVSWNITKLTKEFEQTARIRTNDPLYPEIEFLIRGRIRSEIAMSSDEIHFTDLEVDGEGKFTLDVYSQLLNDFDFDRIESTLDDLVWTVEPMPSQSLEELQARSGYRLKIRLPLRNIDSYIGGLLRMHVQLADEVVLKEVPLRGRMPNRLVLYGADLNVGTGLEMGVMHVGKRYEKRLFLRVRGKKKPDVLKIGRIEPTFVQATLEPVDGRDDQYLISVVVPEDSPMKIFNVFGKTGRLEIENDVSPKGVTVVPLVGAVVDFQN